MGLINTKLTEREKAVIFYAVQTGIENWANNWTKLYAMAESKPEGDVLKDRFANTYASRWKNTAKIKALIEEFTEQKKRNEFKQLEALKREIEKEVEERVRKESEPERPATTLVDYSDPANQRRKLNELVNSASDPGEALDALKVIIAGQKDDKQAAREQQQQRFYVPKRCDDCEIKQAFAKLRLGKG